MILVVMLAASCGGEEEAGPTERVEQALSDYALATAELRIYRALDGRPSRLPKATREYVRIVRLNLDDGTLSKDDALRSLTKIANDVTGSCFDCAQMVDRERENLLASDG